MLGMVEDDQPCWRPSGLVQLTLSDAVQLALDSKWVSEWFLDGTSTHIRPFRALRWCRQCYQRV